jgi:hypothetical protein
MWATELLKYVVSMKYNSFHKKECEVRCLWFTSIILAIWEARIRKTVIQGYPRQIVHATTSKPIAGCSDIYLSSKLHGKLRLESSQFQTNPGKESL